MNADGKIPNRPNIMAQFIVGTMAERKRIGINCWHMGECESAAMWTLHIKNHGGIAIQSRFSKLKKCFTDDRTVYLGTVKYLDYDREYMDFQSNMFSPFMHKRLSYAHEKEARAIVHLPPVDKNKAGVDGLAEFDAMGISVKVDLSVLIERIYVSPQSEKWFNDLVKSVIRQYRYDFEVVGSSLDHRPLF